MSQGQYAPYPRRPVREIDLAVIGEGFKLIWANLGPFAVASVLGYFIPAIAIIVVVIGAEFSMGMFSPAQSSDPALMFSKMGQLYSVQGILYLAWLLVMA